MFVLSPLLFHPLPLLAFLDFFLLHGWCFLWVWSHEKDLEFLFYNLVYFGGYDRFFDLPSDLFPLQIFLVFCWVVRYFGQFFSLLNIFKTPAATTHYGVTSPSGIQFFYIMYKKHNKRQPSLLNKLQPTGLLLSR